MTPEHFKRARQGFSLTQTDLAETLGLRARQVKRYERGDTPIPKTVALIIRGFETGTWPTLFNQSKKR